MIGTFFPDQVFGWTFVVVLLAFLAAASYTDSLRMSIPKAITLPAVAIGVLFNVVRGVWLGSTSEAVWLFGPHGTAVGGLDGFLFAVIGLVSGFGLMLIMWLLGTCGGGDVKLFAAVGAWLGPKYVFYVLVVELPIVVLFTFFRWVRRVLKGEKAPKPPRSRGKKAAAPTENWQPKSRLLAYSVPLALATALVLLWVFRSELGVTLPRDNHLEGQTHAAKQ